MINIAEWISGDWLLIGAAAGFCWLLAILVGNSSFMKEHSITTWGPIIFWRTTRGLNLLDKLSRPKGLWRLLATGGVPLVVVSMTYFLALLLLMSYLMIRSPPEPSSYNAPRNILLIPGINQYIPFAWGWIALFVTLLVHEFAHGILCRVEGVRVKSMGLAFFAAPIAAFVEPDEEELFGTAQRPAVASRRARIRILSAGVISNFLVAAIALALFFGPVIGAIAPVERAVVIDVSSGSAGDLAGFEENMAVLEAAGNTAVNLDQLYQKLSKGQTWLRMQQEKSYQDLALDGDPIRGILMASVFANSPAAKANMPERAVIWGINGAPITSIDDFRSFMNTTSPGQDITIATSQGNYTLRLASKEDGTSLIGIGIAGNAIYIDGITFQEFPSRQFLALLDDLPKRGPTGFLASFLALPFAGITGQTAGGFQGFSGWIESFFQPSDWAEPLGSSIFWMANILFWIGWINLYAGLFNCLPAVPLDGGHIFRDLVQGSLERIFSAKRAEQLTRSVVAIFALLILASLIINVMAPYMAHGFSI